jgi:O-antigen/teichoic acid export membrane protein
MAVSNVLWVPLAAKLAGYERPADTFHVWRRISPVLALLVLVGVTALLCVVPVVVPIWLPHQSETILRIFSYFAVEQAAFMAAFPSLMLLQALGRFGQLGAWALTTSICGVTLTWMLVPRAGAAGFGIANALVTCVVYAPGLLLSEYLYWHRVGVDARGFLARRGGLCLTTTAACLAYAAHPAVAACFLLAVTSACVWALRPWRLIMAS